MRMRVRQWIVVAGLAAVFTGDALPQKLLPIAGAETGEQLVLPRQGETTPSFEVATIRAAADSDGMSIRWMPDGYMAQNVELREVIRAAYGATSDQQIAGGPETLLSQHFDVNTKVDPDLAASMKNMTREDRNRQMALMMQSLLADRFHLKVHVETKEMPIYALVVAKGGPKLKESAPPPPPPSDADGAPSAPPPCLRRPPLTSRCRNNSPTVA